MLFVVLYKTKIFFITKNKSYSLNLLEEEILHFRLTNKQTFTKHIEDFVKAQNINTKKAYIFISNELYFSTRIFDDIASSTNNFKSKVPISTQEMAEVFVNNNLVITSKELLNDIKVCFSSVGISVLNFFPLEVSGISNLNYKSVSLVLNNNYIKSYSFFKPKGNLKMPKFSFNKKVLVLILSFLAVLTLIFGIWYFLNSKTTVLKPAKNYEYQSVVLNNYNIKTIDQNTNILILTTQNNTNLTQTLQSLQNLGFNNIQTGFTTESFDEPQISYKIKYDNTYTVEVLKNTLQTDNLQILNDSEESDVIINL